MHITAASSILPAPTLFFKRPGASVCMAGANRHPNLIGQAGIIAGLLLLLFTWVPGVSASALPFGLDIAGSVQYAGTDAESIRFQEDVLPTVNDWININLGENTALDSTTKISLDPDKLYLATQSEARIYFVGEGAGYHNTLGFNISGGAIGAQDSRLIFPDASSSVSYYDGVSLNGTRTASTPLLPGDFVDLGSLTAGTQLDFFLIANGANGGQNVYSTNTLVNPDGIDHVVAYAISDSPYLLIGFEDLYGGGDRDFNDLLFVADIGSVNVQALTSAPEPATGIILGSFIVFVARLKRNQPALTAET